MIRNFILPSALVIALIAALATNDRGAGHEPDSVAATVNGEKIRIHQIEALLAQTAPGAGEDPRAPAEALERIIDQELLAQEARKAGLERDPRVAEAIESARRRILGQAWLERVASGSRREMGEEIERFYRENPALFRQRRVYRVLEVSAVAPPEMVGEIRKASAGAASLYDVAAWLEARHVPFNVSTASRPAEQIPLHVLPRVAGMREGQIAVFATARGASIVQLLRSMTGAEVGRLRGAATIEYRSDYQARGAGSPSRAGARKAMAVAPLPGPDAAVSN